MRCFAAVVIGTLTTASVASANVEVGGVAGLHTFSSDGGLGAVDQMGVNQNPDGLKNSTFFGIRIGVYFNKQLGVEVEGGAIPTEPRAILFDVWMAAARVQVIYQLRNDVDTHNLIPFLTAGAGLLKIVTVGDASNEAITQKNQKISPYIGVGAKFRTGGGWGVRGDLRGMFAPGDTNKDSNMDGKKDGPAVTLEVEVLLSMYRDFGYKKPTKKKEEAPPPKDDDPDHDGIVGAADKCPNQPEDKDGFEDADGCPDPDNDKDGILDKDDKCPNEPEDKDGFEDADGCPDPDNDKDGILDKDDKCPNEPETFNGYQDADGCPDTVPETLKKFTGAIQGINFKTGDAALAPGSNGVLDKAIAVLKEFATVKLEIQGHTDDQPIRATPKFADNKALSQARADTVKAYFVSKGITEDRLTSVGYGDSMPVVDPKGLTGQKLADARTKNRRVEFKLGGSDAGAAPMAPAPKADPKAMPKAVDPKAAPKADKK